MQKGMFFFVHYDLIEVRNVDESYFSVCTVYLYFDPIAFKIGQKDNRVTCYQEIIHSPILFAMLKKNQKL